VPRPTQGILKKHRTFYRTSEADFSTSVAILVVSWPVYVPSSYHQLVYGHHAEYKLLAQLFITLFLKVLFPFNAEYTMTILHEKNDSTNRTAQNTGLTGPGITVNAENVFNVT